MLVILFLGMALEWVYLQSIADNISGKREMAERLSLGDKQTVSYIISNKNQRKVDLELVDELPKQFQYRESIGSLRLNAKESKVLDYEIQPLERGKYAYGRLFGYLSISLPGLVQQQIRLVEPEAILVYPSIIQMRKYELQLDSRTATLSGIRRIRRVGENDEFEYIRNYTIGDNIKSINWKATSRKNDLMVNQYQNTRSQMIYAIVDKGRSMKMPFFDMTLLDHSINAALVIVNIVLKKYDKAGLITFSNKIGNVLKAESNPNQLERITKYLYDQKTNFLESNFELLFYTIRKNISRRSILFFFTNFETTNDLERNLPYLRAINKMHLLVVIIFINVELLSTTELECKTLPDIYLKTFAKKTIVDKEKLKIKLESHRIQCILTRPEDLSINVINKYLEIKSKRMG